MLRLPRTLAAALLLPALASAAVADDWVATKLRGGVFTYVDSHWVQLFRGDVVPDDRVIRTQDGGRVQFVRGAEMIELGPDTQVQIIDRAGQRFTTVKQYYGKIAVDAEVQNVQHFAVRTPDLAAVVKGTMFTVEADGQNSSVEVQRGHVAVEDAERHLNVTVAAGQAVETGSDHVMEVSGRGELPIVTTANGEPIRTAHRGGNAAANANAIGPNQDGNLESGNGNGNSSSNEGGSGNGNSGNGGGNSGNDSGNGGGDGNSGNGDSGNGGGNGGGDNSGHGGGNDGGDGNDGSGKGHGKGD